MPAAPCPSMPSLWSLTPLWLGPLWPFSLESSLGPQGRLPHPVPCTRRLTVPSDLHAPAFASSRPPLHTSSSGRQPCAPPGAAQPPKAPAPSPPSVEPFPPCQVLDGPLSCAMRPCGQAPSLSLIQSCPLPCSVPELQNRLPEKPGGCGPSSSRDTVRPGRDSPPRAPSTPLCPHQPRAVCPAQDRPACALKPRPPPSVPTGPTSLPDGRKQPR